MTVSWEELFDRATEYGVDLERVRATDEERGAGEGEDEDGEEDETDE